MTMWKIKIHLSKAKYKPLAKKAELVDKLIKAYCNYVALYSDLLQRHGKQSGQIKLTTFTKFVTTGAMFLCAIRPHMTYNVLVGR